MIVFDADTGTYKRHWGAYGAKPDDTKIGDYVPGEPPSKHFRTVHCVIVSKDRFVYVCDRVNDRVQVFRTDGTFVKEAFYETKTIRSGSVWDMAFSRDPQETYIYQVDDYGSALVGTNTIDIYQPTKAHMNAWGVRHVNIRVLRWGSKSQSLAIMKDRAKYDHVRKMVQRIQRG